MQYSNNSISVGIGQRRGAHITFVANPNKPGLVSLYEKLRPETIYQGPFTNSSLTEAKVYDVSSANFRRIWLLYARDLVARAFARAGSRR